MNEGRKKEKREIGKEAVGEGVQVMLMVPAQELLGVFSAQVSGVTELGTKRWAGESYLTDMAPGTEAAGIQWI